MVRKIFQFFLIENLTLLNLYFIDFKICKVSRMHSYDHGRRERKKKKTFGPGMKKKKKEK